MAAPAVQLSPHSGPSTSQPYRVEGFCQDTVISGVLPLAISALGVEPCVLAAWSGLTVAVAVDLACGRWSKVCLARFSSDQALARQAETGSASVSLAAASTQPPQFAPI